MTLEFESLMEFTLASLECFPSRECQINEILLSEFEIMSGRGRLRNDRLTSVAAPLSEIIANANNNLNMFSSAELLPRTNVSPPPPPLFTSSPAKPNNNHSRYKTEICRSYKEQGHCKYGEKCQFAHGPDELRTNNRHPKYKTERCRTYHTTGYCPYGPRCHFIHGEDDEKLSEIRSNRGSRHPSGQSITQYPSSPSTPKPMLIPDSATGLTSSSQVQEPLTPSTSGLLGPLTFHGFDESSNDSVLSFLDSDQSVDQSSSHMTNSFVTIPNRTNSTLPVNVGHISFTSGNNSTPSHPNSHQPSVLPQQTNQSVQPHPTTQPIQPHQPVQHHNNNHPIHHHSYHSVQHNQSIHHSSNHQSFQSFRGNQSTVQRLSPSTLGRYQQQHGIRLLQL